MLNKIDKAYSYKIRIFDTKEEAQDYKKKNKCSIHKVMFADIPYYVCMNKFNKEIAILAIYLREVKKKNAGILLDKNKLYLINLNNVSKIVPLKGKVEIKDIINDSKIVSFFSGESFLIIDDTLKKIMKEYSKKSPLPLIVGVLLIGSAGFYFYNQYQAELAKQNERPRRPQIKPLTFQDKRVLENILSYKILERIDEVARKTLEEKDKDKLDYAIVGINLGGVNKIQPKEWTYSREQKKWIPKNPSKPDRGGFKVSLVYKKQSRYPKIGYKLIKSKDGNTIYQKTFEETITVTDKALKLKEWQKFKDNKMTVKCFSSLFLAPFTSATPKERNDMLLILRDKEFLKLNYKKVKPDGLLYWIKPIVRECPINITLLSQKQEGFNIGMKAYVEEDKKNAKK